MKINEIFKKSHVPENARSLDEDEFYAFIQHMIDASNHSQHQKDEFLEDFNETQYNFNADEMADRINKVFRKWFLPYHVDHIEYKSGYEPTYIVRKLKNIS